MEIPQLAHIDGLVQAIWRNAASLHLHVYLFYGEMTIFFFAIYPQWRQARTS